MPLNGNIDIDFSSEELKCWIENRTVKISVERGSVRNVGSGFIYCMKLKSNIIPIIVIIEAICIKSILLCLNP